VDVLVVVLVIGGIVGWLGWLDAQDVADWPLPEPGPLEMDVLMTEIDAYLERTT